jgi:hypothetical protein
MKRSYWTSMHGNKVVSHLEQIIPGHAGLAGHTGRNDDNIAAAQSLSEASITIVTLLARKQAG